MEYQYKYLVLLGLFGFIFWTLHFWKIKKKGELFLPIKKTSQYSVRSVAKLIVFLIGVCSWILVSYGMMGPRKIKSKIDSVIKTNDIYIVLDISRSMLAQDFSPNRLEMAKKKIIEFIELEPTDRIGIILFSERIYTLLPLTRDLNMAKEIVKTVKAGPLGNGTNIGDALALAIARSRYTKTKQQSIILLTDGVSQVDSIPPLEAARLAQKNKIKIYTVGVGSDKKALIPLYPNSLGGSGSYQEIPGGSLDFELLKKISSLTGGKSYLAKDENTLTDIFYKIEKSEKTLLESKEKKITYDNFAYKYLVFGVFLLLISDFMRRIGLREIL